LSEAPGTEYLYVINYPTFERELALLEIRSLFGMHIEKKYFYSDRHIPPSRSIFIKACISILFRAGSLDDLVDLLALNSVRYEQFKFVRFSVVGGGLGYRQWLHSAAALGAVIEGEVDMYTAEHLLGVTCLEGQWVFGVYESCDSSWTAHDLKPHTYSNALSVRTARSLVNIAVGPTTDTSLVDPCCGIGTVVIEAASMGIDVKGYELNWSIADKANKNLIYFGFDRLVTKQDMHEITETYQAAILDLPYGIFTHSTPQKQQALIKSLRHIAERCVIITFEDMDKIIEDAGFTIIDRATVNKGQFTRIIRVCE
jgi:tRNA (guanine10-N2)-dimethyltransferase